MIIGFNHTSFTVPDLDAAVRFWSALGFSGPGIAERSGDWVGDVTGVPGARIRVAHLYGLGQHMEFIEYAGASRVKASNPPDVPGVGHVCLDCTDIAATAADFIALGATPLGRMTRITDPNMAPSAAGYLRDPNGIIIELYERLSP